MESSSKNNCRFYESVYPAAEDLVIVKVNNVAEMGAYVSLLEYNNIEGMILLSELSRRRIRSINKLIRVGRTEVVVVLRVDREKGYIDLSKRRVSPEDIARMEEKYTKSRAVHSIMRHVAETAAVKLIELYERFGWDLYKRFGHAYDAFKLIVSNESAVLDQYALEPKIRDALTLNIKRRLTPQLVRLRADIEVMCFGYDGIDAIKRALLNGEKQSTEECPIKIKLVAPPLYVLMTASIDKDAGIAVLQSAIDAIEKTIRASNGGQLSVKNAPRAVSERDDRLLGLLMDQLERQNRQVEGDEPAEEDL